MVRIRRFGIVQTANVVAAFYAIVILIVFVPIALLVAVAGRGTGFGDVGAAVVLFGGAVIAVFYAIAIWIFTAIAAALYNLVAGRVGGIEVQLENVAPRPETPAASWGQPDTSGPGAAPSAPPPAQND